LQTRLGKEAACLRLDDFYLDRAHLPLRRRERLNFDHPRSIDWAEFERVLAACQKGEPVQIPKYDFATHARLGKTEWWQPKRIILVEGLWLLRRPALRRLFAFKIYIKCPARLQWRRRLRRDIAERGRSVASVRHQFETRVRPMGKRYVEPHTRWADLVLGSPVDEEELQQLVVALKRL
jgi:uridine kinase